MGRTLDAQIGSNTTEHGVAGWIVEIDEDLCIGAGECVLATPSAFALGDDDAVARVRPGAATVDGLELEEAVRQCPTGAISVRAG